MKASIYVEVPWLLADGRTIVVTGNVRGERVTSFAAEDEDGRPFAFPEDHVREAHEDLVDAARTLWSSP
jgi:hypothetical protein